MDVINNVNKQQFELHLDGSMAFIDYEMKDNKIKLNSTEVPKSMQGKGIGSKLASQTFQLIKGMNLKIIPECEFIQAWLKRHPEQKKFTIKPGNKVD
jgi:predicted GNAT family acetyltransferase